MKPKSIIKPLLFLPIVSFLTACGSSDDDKAQPVDAVNSVPTITSEPIISALEDNLYSYTVVVEDDDTSLTFELKSAPDNMTISDQGVIQWTPTEGVLSSGNIEVSVTDGVNTAVQQAFTIEVTPVNDAPVLADIANQVVRSGEGFNAQVLVTDSDDSIENGELNFSLITAPEGMSIDQSGKLTYQTGATETTLHTVSIKVTDGGEDNAEATVTTFELDEQYFLNISTLVKNYYTEDIIAGALTSLTDGSQILEESISNDQGEAIFSVQDIKITQRMSVVGGAPGFARSALGLNEAQITLQNSLLLQPIHTLTTFDPTADAELSVDSSVLVELSANSLVKPDGSLATGPVNAELTIINPAIDVNLMPGEMITKDESGEIKPIESFGAITVTFKDADGVALNLKENVQAKINIPAVGNFEATVPLYYFDENTSLWVKEGNSELISNPQGNFYTGMVSHFTTWNADRIYDTVLINGCVEDKDLNRVFGAQLHSEGRDYIGSSSTVTDENGQFSIPVKINSNVLISTTAGLLSRTLSIATNDIDKDLDECIVLSEALTKIKLNWGLTPSDLDSHFWGPAAENDEIFHIYFGNPSAVVNDALIFLDVDDVTSYGPEVISISEFALPGTYTYKVHKYSNTPDIDPETTKVELLINNQRYVFSPPNDEEVNAMWYVFDIIISELGDIEVVEVNSYEPEYNYVYSNSSVLAKRYDVPVLNATSYETTYESLVKGKYYSK